jgi:hypothetical protein
MGGKRFDQYRITPDEAGATDYKTLPNDPHETDRSDKSVLTQKGLGAAKIAQPVPPAMLEPETEHVREDELARERHVRAKARKARGAKKRGKSDRSSG